MIIVEVISLIASFGTCVLAFLVWKTKSDALKSASEHKDQQSESDQSTEKSSFIAGIREKITDILARMKKSESKPSSEEKKDDQKESQKDTPIVDIQKKAEEQNESSLTKDNTDSQGESDTKAFDGFNREFQVDDSKDQIIKSLDSRIAKCSFTSIKAAFLIGAVVCIVLAVIFGILNNWIVFGISLAVAACCTAGFAMKQIEYNKTKAIKQNAIDEYTRLKDQVKLLNENKGLSDTEKEKILTRWINSSSEKIDENLGFVKNDSIKGGIIAGVVCLLVVGTGSMLPFIISKISDSTAKDSDTPTVASESSAPVAEETTAETTLQPTSAPTATPTQTPIPTPTTKPVIIVSNPVDLGYLVTDILSSSIDDESSGNNYYPYQVMDGDLNTSWAEGLDDNGIGEYLVFSIPKGTYISGLVIYTGYCKSSNVFYKNGAPSVIDVYSGNDGYRVDLNTSETGYAPENYENALEGIYVTFPSAIVSNGELRITIVDVRDGEAWDDTNISEIRIMGTPASGEVSYSDAGVVGDIKYSGYHSYETSIEAEEETTTYVEDNPDSYENEEINYVDELEGFWTTWGNQGGTTSLYYQFRENDIVVYIHDNEDGSNTEYTHIDIEYETTSDGYIKVNLIYRHVDDFYFSKGDYYLLDEYDSLSYRWENNGYSGSSSLTRV